MMKIGLKKIIQIVLLMILWCSVIVAVKLGPQKESFNDQAAKDKVKHNISKNGEEYRIVCLGESTTIWDGDNSWPSHLERILIQKNLGVEFKIINKGRHNTQTSYLISILKDTLDEYCPQMVITMMGINDGENTAPYDIKEAKAKKEFLSGRKESRARDEFLIAREMRNQYRRGLRENRYNQNMEVDNKKFHLGRSLLEQAEYEEAEEIFKNILKMHPNSVEGYIRLAQCYRYQGRFSEAIDMLKRAETINSKDGFVFVQKGECYQELGQYLEAKKEFFKALNIVPSDDWTYVDLGRCYQARGEYQEAIKIFWQAIEINRHNTQAFIQLGSCYKDLKRYDKAIEVLKEAIKVNSKNYVAYIELAMIYREQGKKWQEEEDILKELVKVSPMYAPGHAQLGIFYGERKQYSKAEEALKKAIEIHPYNMITYIILSDYYKVQGKDTEIERLLQNAEKYIEDNDDRFYGYLAVYYLEQGNYVLAEKYFRQADEIRLRYYSPMTRQNYQKLKNIVTKRGITLVCVQYPMRSIEPLKKYFDSTEGMIFVDNEKIFKEAVKKGKYEDYFEDAFAGDFGHGISEGNKILAENIVDVILKEVFNR